MGACLWKVGNRASPVGTLDVSSSESHKCKVKRRKNGPGSNPMDIEGTGGKVCTVMRRYTLKCDAASVLGEGTSSICRQGIDTLTGQSVAIKVYKWRKTSKPDDSKMLKFKRQINVLKMLQEPFVANNESAYHCEALMNLKPSELFMTLLDYSKDSRGQPGPDPDDGMMYTVTEVAEYSLKDYISMRRHRREHLSRESVRSIVRAVMLVITGLHAKDLVHIDLKPENLMMFKGHLKLIDVDGSVKKGTDISVQDSSISFSPCYCAPEWASFLLGYNDSTNMRVSPCLDVWSVGMTLSELVTLDPILKPTYAHFLGDNRSARTASFMFMEWLSSVKEAPIPSSIKSFDEEFWDLLANNLLVCNPKCRKTLAQSLRHPFVALASQTPQTLPALLSVSGNVEIEPVVKRYRDNDCSSGEPLYKGTLWKLNTNGNPNDLTAWLQRDMWITKGGNLCYFSLKENKRLVLIDAKEIAGADVLKFVSEAKKNCFELRLQHDGEERVSFILACNSPEEYSAWTTNIRSCNGMMDKIHLGAEVAEEINLFKLSVRNRRTKVSDLSSAQFEPLLKGFLWKLKTQGERTKPEDWFLREMWLTRNGSFMYWSKRDERELIYYNANDVSNAACARLTGSETARQHVFQIVLQPSDGIEFTPGEFAAESSESREKWIAAFQRFQAGSASV